MRSQNLLLNFIDLRSRYTKNDEVIHIKSTHMFSTMRWTQGVTLNTIINVKFLITRG